MLLSESLVSASEHLFQRSRFLNAIFLGYVALQGAFAEHQTMLQRSSKSKVSTILVRTPEDLAKCDALIIPGGGEFLPLCIL